MQLLTINSEVVLSDTIVVRVAAVARRYTLHKRLLIHHSKYFSGALSNLRESKEGLVVLEAVDAEVFDVFVDWIYEKTLPEKLLTPKTDNGVVSLHRRAYMLADRLIASGFKRKLFDVIFDRYSRQRKFPRYATISFAFDNLPDGDPLLQLLIDTFCVDDALQRYPRVRSQKKQCRMFHKGLLFASS